MTFHVWLDDVAVLVLFVGVARLVSNASCESKFSDAVEPVCGDDGLRFLCFC